jgi:hypothetical protein
MERELLLEVGDVLAVHRYRIYTDGSLEGFPEGVGMFKSSLLLERALCKLLREDSRYASANGNSSGKELDLPLDSTGRMPLFAPQENESTWVRVLSQFFNISDPSADNMKFLLFVRRFGLSNAKKTASDLAWQCDAAIAAVEQIAR